MTSKYPEPPREIEQLLGPAAYEYLRDLHDIVLGAGIGGKGTLTADNLGVTADGALPLIVRSDGVFEARRQDVSELASSSDGVIQSSGGKIRSAPLGAEGLATTEKNAAYAFRTDGTGAGVFTEDIGTRVPGAANLIALSEHPSAGQSTRDLTHYTADDYVVYQFVRKDSNSNDETVYKYMDMRDDGNKAFRTSLEPPPAREDDVGSVSGGGAASFAGGTPASYSVSSLADPDFSALMVLT